MRVPHPAHLRGARARVCARTELARSVSLCVSDSNQCVRSPACSEFVFNAFHVCAGVCSRCASPSACEPCLSMTHQAPVRAEFCCAWELGPSIRSRGNQAFENNPSTLLSNSDLCGAGGWVRSMRPPRAAPIEACRLHRGAGHTIQPKRQTCHAAP